MCDYKTISQLISHMRNNEVYEPLDNFINIKYICKVDNEIHIEPKDKNCMILVDSNARFIKVLKLD